MANITCIIGNGLDISLKLNTTYKAFYNYVKKSKLHPNNSIYAAIEKDVPELWADFELGLGRFTNTIESVTEKERVNWSQTLNKELDEIKKDLKLYIKQQNEMADEHIKNIEFTKQSLYSGLETGQETNVVQHLSGSRQTAIQFITLNYTNVLEKLFPHAGRVTVGKDYHIPTPIHHIHGSINRRISLGVNDESQLSSYIDTDEKNYLIKPELIRLMNDGRIETMTHLINSSHVMVLFGVSLGATDKYIWNTVVSWLNRYNDKLLIIHHYESGLDVNDLTERELLLLSDRVKNKFLSYSKLEDDKKNELKRKIYVIPNSPDLFAVKQP